MRRDLRLLRELRTGQVERRGRPTEYDDEALIDTYIEIEAHARLHYNGRVSVTIAAIKARVEENGRRRPLKKDDVARLRSHHMLGKREADRWRTTIFMGRPHPTWQGFERRIEQRMDELRTSGSRLFSLKKL
jgi:hypothetical protein